MLQLLDDTDLSQEQHMYLKSCTDSANILMTLINDILGNNN